MPQESNSWWSTFLSNKDRSPAEAVDSRGASSASTKTPPAEGDRPVDLMETGDLDLAAASADAHFRKQLDDAEQAAKAQRVLSAETSSLQNYLPARSLSSAMVTDDAMAAAEADAAAQAELLAVMMEQEGRSNGGGSPLFPCSASRHSMTEEERRQVATRGLDSPPLHIAVDDEHGTYGGAMHQPLLPPTPIMGHAGVPVHVEVEDFRDGGLTRALIEKQHDVARFLMLNMQEIPTSTMTKMQMMKTELDLLSSSIGGVLGTPPQNLAPHHYAGSSAQLQAYVTPGAGQGYHVDAVQASYASEVDFVDPTTGQMVPQTYHTHTVLQDGQCVPVGVAPAPDAPPAAAGYEEDRGPAVFQGFQPPPSFAWGKMCGGATSSAAEDSAAAAATAAAAADSAAAPAQQPTDPAQVPRPKPVRPSSPLTTGCGNEPSSMRLAFNKAMEELQRCRGTCASLREEKRGVPAAEVEQWCASLSTHLGEIAERLSVKLEAHRKKAKAKDETIRRLYKLLQERDLAADNASPSASSAASAQRSPAGSKGRRGMLHESPASARGTTPPGNAAANASPSRRAGLQGSTSDLARTFRGQHDNDADDARSQTPRGAMQGLLPDSDVTLDPEGAYIVGDGMDENEDMAMLATTPPVGHGSEVAASKRATSPSLGPSASARTSSKMGREDKQLTAARGRRAPDPATQKTLRQAGGVAPASARRRGEPDAVHQLRVKEAQVEQLTEALHDLSQVTQRQIGLYKRQLQLKDNSIHTLQDKLMQEAPATAAALQASGDMGGTSSSTALTSGMLSSSATTTGSSGSLVPRPSGAVGERSRRAAQVPGAGASPNLGARADGIGLAHLAAQAGRGNRGGTTPRPGESADRGRTSTAATWPVPKKEPRERSQGAMPHSPRSRHRDVATVSGQLAVTASATEVALARRRTQSGQSGTGSAGLGRASSSDDKRAAAAAAAAKASGLRSSFSQATRQRR